MTETKQRNTTTLSIVLSAFNEEQNIAPLYAELKKVVDQCNLRDYELIFVNDGSYDQTLQRCLDLAVSDPKVKIVNLARNFGHEVAMTAGMDHAKFDGVLFMDADFQHPPSLIPQLLKLWEHNDLVLTKRLDNHGKTGFQKFLSRMYYKVINYLSSVEIPPDTPDFRLIDRKYVDVIKQMNESERLFRGLLNWIGTRSAATVEFEAPPRRYGESKYNLRKSISLALDSVLQFSVRPLRVSLYLGLLAAFFAIALGLYTVWSHFTYNPEKTGYATTILTIVFMGSIQLIVLGIIGEYVGRIHLEVKRRPLYVASYISYGENDAR